MAVTVLQIREALAASLAALDGIQVSPYMLANPTPPAGHIYPSGTEYDLAAGRGLDNWVFTVQLFVTVTLDVGAQVKLDAFLAPAGAQSVKALIEADGTLGGIVQDTNVVGNSGYRQFQRENQIVLGADWRVEVLATGK